jgi:23S rRNA pseudouridine1911/1915/1917 synthase
MRPAGLDFSSRFFYPLSKKKQVALGDPHQSSGLATTALYGTPRARTNEFLRAMECISRTIGSDDEGRRLDLFLAALEGRFSRAEVQRQIRDGRAVINARTIRQPSYRLRVDDQVEWRPEAAQALHPNPLSIRVIHEDEDIVVLDKPAGLVVHPGAGTRGATTLVEGLLATRYLPPSDDPVRPGIVHRIDKETTGVLVVAKTPRALDALKRQFADRTVEKQYLAWVSGALDEHEGRIEAPVGRDPRSPRRMTVLAAGRPAETDFRVLARQANRTLVLIRPRTGRTHQIRVHFRYIGHPVVGDRLYGGPPARALLLHAWTLSIAHPTSGERRTFVAPPPSAFPREAYEPLPPRDSAASR